MIFSSPIFHVFGANTGVGKTLFSAGLCRSALRRGRTAPSTFGPKARLFDRVVYLKPVQTGFPTDSDARHVSWHCPGSETEVLFTYSDPVSPHLAAIRENRVISDAVVLEKVRQSLWKSANGVGGNAFVIVEGAGGVASPSISGSLQCDLYRPLRLPVILIGSSELGGISTTVSAYESLLMRGYDVAAIATLDDGALDNAKMISRHIGKSIPIVSIPSPPARLSSDNSPEKLSSISSVSPTSSSLLSSPPSSSPSSSFPSSPLASLTPSSLTQAEIERDRMQMDAWYRQVDSVFDQLLDHALDFHEKRLKSLASLEAEAAKFVWWPFTQHATVDKVMVIDSAFKDDYTVFSPKEDIPQNQFDGCATWWTQGVGHGDPEMSRAIAAAAGRYGHVMLPECAHDPAVSLARRLVESGPGKAWGASRVFFSDDGSTALEVAIKMAFRRAFVDHRDEWGNEENIFVAGLTESYHGDTIGSMDLSSPNVFNRRVPWYSSTRGVWIDPPTVEMKNAKVKVKIPSQWGWSQQDSDLLAGGKDGRGFDSVDEVFDESRHSTDGLTSVYRAMAHKFFEEAVNERKLKIGALVLEPILHGAGGMLFIDPLFQRELVLEARRRSIPVIFDEVFVGTYRLGPSSVTQLLRVEPDIACYAKTLTGGTVPLAVTLATERVFEAFLDPGKINALLHGHSYTAHPVGCAAALKALEMYESLAETAKYRKSGLVACYDEALCRTISSLPNVERLVCLGTVLAVEVKSSVKGYASSGAGVLAKRLLQRGIYTRSLGPVVYLMANMFTSSARLDGLLDALHGELLRLCVESEGQVPRSNIV